MEIENWQSLIGKRVLVRKSWGGSFTERGRGPCSMCDYIEGLRKCGI